MKTVVSFIVGLTLATIAIHYFTGVNILVEGATTVKQIIKELT